MKILSILLSLILATPVLAQDKADKYKASRTVYCFDLNDLWDAAKTIEQNIVWVGKDDSNTQYALLVSEKTKHFTIVHFNDTRGCIIGGGSDFRYGKAFDQPKDSKK